MMRLCGDNAVAMEVADAALKRRASTVGRAPIAAMEALQHPKSVLYSLPGFLGAGVVARQG